LYLAHTYNQIAGFEGTLAEWYIEFGDDAWTTPETAYCEDGRETTSTDCVVVPTTGEDCVILYSECEFAGTSVTVCED